MEVDRSRAAGHADLARTGGSAAGRILEGASRPCGPAAGVSRRLCAWGPDSADWNLHTGQVKSDLNIHLDLLGPAAFSSGHSRSKEGHADQTGMERVESTESERAGTIWL